ncbi:MAG TPA: type II secretion system F family protein, partial [Armatimonadetes bacterium]|nr:type II secretion system F family protein [Armatimonadota bacterium]
MPAFQYVALDARGVQVRGELVAESREAVIAQLRQMGHYPLDVRLSQVGEAPARRRRPLRRRRVSHQDLTIFSRQLSNLVHGGLPLMRCLEALIEHTENPFFVSVLEQVREELRGGSTFWEALEKHPQVFPPLYVSLVRAGETAGQLPSILDWLADYMERQQARIAQIRATMAYPILLLILGSIAVFFLVTFMVPRFQAIFQELGQALPLPTVILLNISHFMAQWWWAMLLGIALIVYLYRRAYATPTGRLILDSWKLRYPIYSRLALKMAVARFARALATLLRGGVPILEALEVVREVVGNEVLATELDKVRNRVREGESIAEHLRARELFPPLLIHMVAVGEEVGNLPDALLTVADA